MNKEASPVLPKHIICVRVRKLQLSRVSSRQERGDDVEPRVVRTIAS